MNIPFRAETLRDGHGPYVERDDKPKGSALGVLRYDESPLDELEDPTDDISHPLECTKENECLVLNCPWKEFHSELYPYTKCLHIEELRMDNSAAGKMDKSALLEDEDVHEIFLNFAFGVGSSVNNHRFISPASAPIYDEKTEMVPCLGE